MKKSKPNPWNTSARKAATGYKLQTKRLIYSGKESVRSFKIPLHHRDPERFNNFSSAVRNDYINQVGLVNFADWYEHKKGGQDLYSLADFWLDSLRAGVIFAHKETVAKNLVYEQNGNQSIITRFRKTVEEKYPDLYELADIESFYEFCTSKPRPGSKSKDEFTQSQRNKIFPSYKNKTSGVVDRYVDTFVEWTWETDKDEYANYVSEFLGFTPIPTLVYDFNFFIHSELPFSKQLAAKDLLFQYRKFVEDRPVLYGEKVSTEDRLKMALGLFNNHGAFSTYFHPDLLNSFKNQDPKIREQIINNSDYWNNHQDELDERLSFLQQQAAKLATTHLAGPHEYRSSLGGKIESWVSNTINQVEHVNSQLFITKDEESGSNSTENNETELQKIISDDLLSEYSRDLAQECLTLLNQMKPENQEINDTNLSLYRQLIANLRTQLNLEYQDLYPEIIGDTEKERKKDRESKRANEIYPSLFKDIRLIPNFLGETKRKIFRKHLNSANTLNTGINFIKSIDEQIGNFEHSPRFENENEAFLFLRRQLETIRRKYYQLNSSRFKHILEKILTEQEYTCKEDGGFYIGKLFLRKGKEYLHEKYYSFYIHPLARNNNRYLIELNIDPASSISVLNSLLQKLKPRWSEIIESQQTDELIDAIEIEKVRLGILVSIYNSASFKLDYSLIDKELFKEASAYLELKGNPSTLSGPDLGRLLQSSISSEIKGALNRISRTDYTERYVAQPMNTETKYPLAAQKHKTESGQKISWHIIDSHKESESEEMVLLQKKDNKPFTGLASDYKEIELQQSRIFDLISSKYHLQFLNKTLGPKLTSWWYRQHMGVALNSYSFIYEQDISLSWDLVKGELNLERKTNRKNNRLFVSLPFTLKPQQKGIDFTQRTRLMGIDVGEYGLAWTILEVEDQKEITKDSIRILNQGFIYEPLTHKVREYVSTIKANQIKGTFGMPNTKLERLRKNAITSLRNQVHDIAMRYHAKPVYEFEISNFETGSNRVKVIYDSVKRADTGRGRDKTQAENAEADLVWGKMSKQFGAQIGAYATSYICTSCGYSPYLEFEQQRINRDELNQQIKSTRLSIEDFLTLLPEHREEPSLQKTKNDSEGVWRTRRGNSALYVCQSCNAVSDADIQASYWIALKSLMRQQQEGKKKDAESSKSNELTALLELHDSKKNKTVINFSKI